MKDIIEEYLTENFLFEFDDEITEHDDLFKLGLIDSIGYIELVNFLKKNFDIEFTEEDMLNNVLVSLNTMVAFVEERTQ